MAASGYPVPLQPVVTVTVFTLGEAALGPLDLEPGSAVRELRSKVLALQPDEERGFPWRPELRIEVALLLGDQVLEDGDELHGAHVELTAAVHKVEVKKEGQTLEDVIRQIEEGEEGEYPDWHGSKCLGLYVHGSWAYSYKTAEDVDLFAIAENPPPGHPNHRHYHQGGSAAELKMKTCFGSVQVVILTRDHFLAKLNAMDLTALTCLSLPPCFVLREFDDERARNVSLNIPLLKQSIIAFADAKYLSAVLHGFEDKAGCKQVYYAFRALAMGIQLVMHGRIVELQAGKEWYEKACAAFESLGGAVPESLLNSDYQDFVQAVFAHDFDRQVQRFCSVVEQTSSPAETSGDLGIVETCRLCQAVLGEKGSGENCQLVNCGHQFHSKCMAISVRTQHLQDTRYWHNDDRCGWDICHPIAKCPTCEASVRLELSLVRADNLQRVLHDRPLDGAGAALHILYLSTVNFHQLLRYSAWDTAVPKSEVPSGKRFVFKEGAK